MTRIAAALSALAIVLVMTSVVTRASAVEAIAAKVDQVFVTNDPTHPIPTSPQGTTTVAGTVSANQSGSWLVGASQAGPWNIGVTNTSANPVPVAATSKNVMLAESPAGGVTGDTSFRVDSTVCRQIRINIFYHNVSNPNAKEMDVIVRGANGEPADVMVLTATSVTGKVFDAPGPSLSFTIRTADWTSIDAEYAVYCWSSI